MYSKCEYLSLKHEEIVQCNKSVGRSHSQPSICSKKSYSKTEHRKYQNYEKLKNLGIEDGDLLNNTYMDTKIK